MEWFPAVVSGGSLHLSGRQTGRGMMEINGVEVAQIWGWRTGQYLITTDTVYASETHQGYFTVAKVTDSGNDHVTLKTVGQMTSLADAVTLTVVDARGVRS